jgi:hypothetical protein
MIGIGHKAWAAGDAYSTVVHDINEFYEIRNTNSTEYGIRKISEIRNTEYEIRKYGNTEHGNTEPRNTSPVGDD